MYNFFYMLHIMMRCFFNAEFSVGYNKLNKSCLRGKTND